MMICVIHICAGALVWNNSYKLYTYIIIIIYFDNKIDEN